MTTEAVFKTMDFNNKLQAFFPPGDRNSDWLLRLMIIRDDVHFEWSNIQRGVEGTDDAWRLTYFLRRISVSLLEAKDIFDHELSVYLERHKKADPSKQDEALLQLTPIFEEAIEKVIKLAAQLKKLRDSVGGHVRPSNAVRRDGHKVTNTVLNNHPLLEGTVHVLGPTDEVSYRALSAFAILFAWPEADDNDKAMARLVELQTSVAEAARSVNIAIDAVLAHRWLTAKLIGPPLDHQMCVRDAIDPDVYHPI